MTNDTGTGTGYDARAMLTDRIREVRAVTERVLTEARQTPEAADRTERLAAGWEEALEIAEGMRVTPLATATVDACLLFLNAVERDAREEEEQMRFTQEETEQAADLISETCGDRDAFSDLLGEIAGETGDWGDRSNQLFAAGLRRLASTHDQLG